jgi:ribosomal protein S18 acetylase RimI-like enzyme
LPKVIAEWSERLDYDRALPLLALVGNRVVADAALIRSRTGSRRHVGEIRLTVDPEFRQRGLGTILIRELCDIANDAGLERVIVEIVEGIGGAMLEMVERLGFVRTATLREHVKDREGKPHDLAIMVLTLGKWHEWWHF